MIARWTLLAGLAALVVLVAGCEGEQMTSGTPKADPGGGAITGLLINGQTLEGKSVDLAHETVKTWTLVDSTGQKIFGKEDIDPAFLKAKGAKYEWRREKALEGTSLFLGKNFKEIPITIELSGDEKNQKATLKVTAAVAAELRAIPNLSKLVSQCRIVFLLGKIGR